LVYSSYNRWSVYFCKKCVKKWVKWSFCFKNAEVKSQSLKNKGTNTIRDSSMGNNTNLLLCFLKLIAKPTIIKHIIKQPYKVTSKFHISSQL
jgi:hypothetical protein